MLKRFSYVHVYTCSEQRAGAAAAAAPVAVVWYLCACSEVIECGFEYYDV